MTYNLERMGYVPPLLLWSAEQFRRGGRSSACMDYIYYTERKRMDDLVCNYFFEFPINLRTSLSHVSNQDASMSRQSMSAYGESDLYFVLRGVWFFSRS